MKTHTIKIEKHFMEDLLSGDKTFELRYNDRAYQKGDKLEFYFPNNPESFIEGSATISYVLSHPGLAAQWVALGLKDIKSRREAK